MYIFFCLNKLLPSVHILTATMTSNLDSQCAYRNKEEVFVFFLLHMLVKERIRSLALLPKVADLKCNVSLIYHSRNF